MPQNRMTISCPRSSIPPNGSTDSFHLSSTQKNRRRSSPWFSFAFFSFIKERKEDEGPENKVPIDFCRQTRHMPNGSTDSFYLSNIPPNGSIDSFHLSSIRKNRRRSSPWFSFAFFSFIKERKEDKGSENKALIDFCRQTRHMPNGSKPFRRHTRYMPIRINHFKPHKPLLRFCNVLVWDREGCVRSCGGIAWAENIKWRECYLVALIEQLSRKNVS